jgi:cyanophycinase
MSKGYLILIGGGEDTALIYNKMIGLAGGKDEARVAVIPAASSQARITMDGYEEYFISEMGLKKENVWTVPLAVVDDKSTSEVNEQLWKENALKTEYAEKIKKFNVIFFAGGDQRRYIDALKKNNVNSPLLNAIMEVYENNGIIVGTSAGTNILCTTSIGGGRSEEALTTKVVYDDSEDDGQKLLLLKGLGLVDNIIFDTHFSQRGRIGRLIESAILSKNNFGIGISEKTAVIYHPDNKIEILGYGHVFVVDMSDAVILSEPELPVHVLNISVHLFSHGDKFNMTNCSFEPLHLKEDIKNTPYFDSADYHISLNVFKEYETSNIIINYMLDNEAEDVIALMDYDKQYTSGDNSYFLRFVERNDTMAYFCKTSLDNTDDNIDFYSGLNVYTDVIPLLYSNADNKAKGFQAIVFGIGDRFIAVVYDDKESLPVCDAKVQVFNNENKLIFKCGTDKFGKIEAKGILTDGEGYYLKIKYDLGILTKKFVYSKNMKGICLR